MRTKYKLVMKPLNSDNPETMRIYRMVNDACERFNIYVLDFFETLAILEEKKKEGRADEETDKSIESVTKKIDEVTTAMKEIASSMSSLVELKEI